MWITQCESNSLLCSNCISETNFLNITSRKVFNFSRRHGHIFRNVQYSYFPWEENKIWGTCLTRRKKKRNDIGRLLTCQCKKINIHFGKLTFNVYSKNLVQSIVSKIKLTRFECWQVRRQREAIINFWLEKIDMFVQIKYTSCQVPLRRILMTIYTSFANLFRL